MVPPASRSPSGSPLDRLRGAATPARWTARTITALTANPGCSRRAVLDAARIDKGTLASRVGFPAPYGQSPFAITRSAAFEQQVKANGCAELLTILRQELDVPVAQAHLADLTEVGGNAADGVRAAETRRLIAQTAREEQTRLILDHPLLAFEVADRTAYLEPDAITHQIAGRFHLISIKSFAAIDGQADAGKVAEAAKQAAVHVLALRRLLTDLGLDAGLVADDFLLVCPKDFASRPYGRLVDLRQQLDAVDFQLGRLGRAESLLADSLPGGASLDLSETPQGGPARTPEQLRATLEGLPYRYVPGCLDYCELSRCCREQARAEGEPSRLGTAVRDDLPGIDGIPAALRLVDDTVPVSPEQQDAAGLLRAAARLRGRHLGCGGPAGGSDPTGGADSVGGAA